MGVRHTIKIGKFSAGIGQRADLIKRKIALGIFAELLQTTPIDTGRARAGWSIDTRHGAFIPAKDKSGFGYDVSTRVDPSRVPTGSDIIYIYNNVGYIGRLNAGSSTQAPREFVQLAIDRVVGGMSA